MPPNAEQILISAASAAIQQWGNPLVEHAQMTTSGLREAEGVLATLDSVLTENKDSLKNVIPNSLSHIAYVRDSMAQESILVQNAQPEDWVDITSSLVKGLRTMVSDVSSENVSEMLQRAAKDVINAPPIQDLLFTQPAPPNYPFSSDIEEVECISPSDDALYPSHEEFIDRDRDRDQQAGSVADALPHDEASTSGAIAHAGALANIGENVARAGLDVIMSELTQDSSGGATNSCPGLAGLVTSSNAPNITSLIKTAMQSKTVLNLGGDLAQLVVDAIQERLHTSSLGDLVSDQIDHHSVRKDVIYTMRKLSMTSERLSSSLFLDGVQRLPELEYEPVYGGFADVYRGMYNGQMVALKCLRVTASDVARGKMDFFRESLMWANLRHDHVLPFLGVDKQHTMCMVLPWMEHGNINERIKSLRESNSFSDGLPQVNQWIHEIALGLAFLHTEEIVHGDLRGANILIDQDFKVRLSDFGLAVFAEASSKRTSSGSMKPWLAPELAFPEHYGLDSSRPTQPGDIYALGCVCFELYTGQLPLSELSAFNRILEVVMRGRKPVRPSFYGGEMMNDALWLLVDQTFEKIPRDRPTAVEVVKGTKVFALHSESV